MTDRASQLVNGFPRQRRYAPRSRGGCITCRQRRKRCPGADQSNGEVDCASCRRLNLDCQWDARRRIHSARENVLLFSASTTSIHATGHTDGRNMPVGDDCPRPSSPAHVPTPFEGTRNRHQSSASSPRGPSLSPGLTPDSIGRITPDVADQRIFMSYYVHCFVPNISVVNIPTSFFTSVYVPMAMHCEAIRSAMLASATAHLSKGAAGHDRDRLLGLSIRYQRQCHHFLQDRITLSGRLQRDTLESLVVVLLLIGLEVQNGAHTHKWMSQLDCARNIIKNQGGAARFSQSSWEAEAVYHHFLYHDVMSLIMAGVTEKAPDCPNDNDDEADEDEDEDLTDESRDGASPSSFPVAGQVAVPWAAYLSAKGHGLDKDCSETVHPLLGMSRDLFILMQKIRRIRHLDGTNASDNNLFFSLERKISALQFDLYPQATDMDGLSLSTSGSPKLDAATRLDLLTLAETYRLAALVLLYRRSPSHAHQLPALASHILSLVGRIPAGASAEAGLTYPLFLAGAELSKENDILRCANKLISIRERFKVLNIQSVEKVLEAVWRKRLNGGDDWDWEHILRKWQWVISLA